MRQFDAHVVCHEHLDSARAPWQELTVVPRTPTRRYAIETWPQRLRNRCRGNRFGATGAVAAGYAEALRRVRPDVVLCHFARAALHWQPVVARAGVPVVVHFHGIDCSAWLKAGRYAGPIRAVLPSVARTVVVAPYMRENLIAIGYPVDRIHLVPYGTPAVAPTERPIRTGGPVTVLAVGRLVAKKAPVYLIRAFKRALELGADATLRVVGDGPLSGELNAAIDALGVRARVVLLGSVPFDRVREEMRDADVFAQHSVTGPDGDMEGWPVAIAEAMSFGLPVISTRHAGIIGQVIEGATGFLVDEGDWAGMGERLAEVCGSVTLRREFSEAGRARASAHFDVGRQVAELEGVLLRAAGDARRPAAMEMAS